MNAGLTAWLTGYLTAEVTAPAGQTVAVVGPNGAGKTTLLRALAGLPAPATARLELDGQDVTEQPPHRRSIGYVPQDAALFPHQSALGNVAYGLRARGMRRRAAETAAREWLTRLGVGELVERRPAQLSGGQQQRVALARALAVRPRLLLLDEPFAALDVATRAEVRHLLRTHLGGYDGVCLIVTHDPVDALALADRILVVEAGRVVQDASPAEVTRAPRSAWVARMLGRNAYVGVATATGIALPGGATLVAAEPLSPGRPALAIVDPEDVALYRTRPAGSPRNCWAGHVVMVSPVGTRLRVAVRGATDDGPGVDIVSEVTPSAATELGLAEGTAVWVSVKATEVTLTGL